MYVCRDIAANFPDLSVGATIRLPFLIIFLILLIAALVSLEVFVLSWLPFESRLVFFHALATLEMLDDQTLSIASSFQ